MKAKLIIFNFLLSIALYILSPNHYSFSFILCIFVLYVCQIFLYYKIKRKDTYWEFDTIFLFVFTIASFAYPLFFYDENDPFFPFKNLPFNVNIISKSVAGSFVAVSSYTLGGICKKKINRSLHLSSSFPTHAINTKPLVFFVILLSIAFILSGGIEFFQSQYNNDMEKIQNSESGLMFQIMELLMVFAISAVSIEFYNKVNFSNYSYNKSLILIIVLISVAMLYAGNRTLTMRLMLPMLFLYSFFFYKISKFKFLLIALVGIVGMTIIGFLRTGLDGDSIFLNIDNIFRDIVIPARNNYLVYEVVEQEGFSYGSNFVLGLTGVIPSFPRLLSMIGIDLYMLGSAEFFTTYTQASVDYKLPGLGTMLQADAYYAWGIFGVIFVFFMIGFIVDKYFKEFKEGNYYSYVIYSCLMANSIFWVRGAATLPVKSILWCILVLYIIRYWEQRNEKNIILHTRT